MERFRRARHPDLVLRKGDLTREDVDAIVNAANERMLGGGGVDGAIHRAAGPRLLEACLAVPEVTPGVRCATGEARLTPGFDLRARHVIHTVGPVYRSAAVSAPLLRRAYLACLDLARQHELQSIAFPALSCGAYGYPLGEAATIAVDAWRTHPASCLEVRFVLFGEEAYQAWCTAAERAAAAG